MSVLRRSALAGASVTGAEVGPAAEAGEGDAGAGWSARVRAAVRVERSAWPGLLAGATLVAVLLGVFAYVLASTEATSRREARQRFGAQATIAAGLTDAILATLESSATSQASSVLGGAIDTAVVRDYAKRSNDAFLAVTAGDGRLLAASSDAAGALLSSPRALAAMRAAESGAPRFSDLFTGPGGATVAIGAIPFSGPAGRRIEVVGYPAATLYVFFSGLLAGALPSASTHAFVLDGNGRILGSQYSGARAGERVPVYFWNVLRRHRAGGYHGASGSRYVVAAPIRTTGWRMAITEPLDQLYTALSGSRSWVLWAVFAALASASLVGLGLLARALSSKALIARQSRELARANRALTSANAELDAFSYSVSHDLRAPLRAVDGFSQILLSEHAGELAPDARHYLDVVRRNAVGMGALIDGLLAFSRLGQQQLSVRTVDVERLAQDVVVELQSTPGGAAAEITVEQLPPARADAALLRQVFVNLLSNALKYSRGRSPAIIQVGAERLNGVPVYFVRDNGAGFDMRHADKLFKVFQRLHRAEDYEGTGVGLALVARIVGRHGGRVWADSKPDGGATFHFTLGAAADGR